MRKYWILDLILDSIEVNKLMGKYIHKENNKYILDRKIWNPTFIICKEEDEFADIPTNGVEGSSSLSGNLAILEIYYIYFSYYTAYVS